MRQVQVSKMNYQDVVKVDPSSDRRRIIKENVKVDDYKGKFHGFGVDVYEGVLFTAAIIEKESGEVELVHPSMIKFIS